LWLQLSLSNEAFLHKVGAQGEEIQIALEVAEALDGATERRAWFDMHQCAEPARCAHITRWKYVEASEAAQQHEPGAPRAYARQCVQGLQRIRSRHAGNPSFIEFARLDRPGETVQRFSFS
jgi:hypothetical protein